MKIIIAPDSFKESMSAMEAAQAIESGFQRVFSEAEYIKVPMADGGEGTVQSIVDATNGKIMTVAVTGPLGQKVKAFYGVTGNGKAAVIEMAAASGLHLIPEEKRNPLYTTTRGTGELIIAALEQGVDHVIIGIGGSATNDGGAGMAQALGASLLDSDGKDIGYGGGELSRLSTIDMSHLDSRLSDVSVDIACDVDNPLLGKHGATAIFGPQKGATPDMGLVLEENLTHYASVLKIDLGKDVANIPGSGAAGGLGAGLLAFLNAKLKRGVDVVIEAVQLDNMMKGASLAVTGEGKLDHQTAYGKTPMGVAKIAKKHGVPVIGIAGMIEMENVQMKASGIDAIFPIVPGPIDVKDAMEHAIEYTEQAAENIAGIIKISLNKDF